MTVLYDEFGNKYSISKVRDSANSDFGIYTVIRTSPSTEIEYTQERSSTGDYYREYMQNGDDAALIKAIKEESNKRAANAANMKKPSNGDSKTFTVIVSKEMVPCGIAVI